MSAKSKTVAPVKSQKVAQKDNSAVAINNRKRHLPPLQKNNVKQVKHTIRVIKRQGGTMRFAKKLRIIRKNNDAKREIARRLAKKWQANARKTSAVKKVEGKTTKDGKAISPRIKKEKKYCIKRMRSMYKTQLAPRTLPSKNLFLDMNIRSRPKIAHLRRSLVPGTVCVLLAGKYKGSKVVFLKQLKRSGLCLVTGPFKMNQVPLRRMNQNYMIATSVRVNMEGVKVPKHINDFYFRREKIVKKKKAAGEEEIFETKKKEKDGPNKQKRVDQKRVDRMIVHNIKKMSDNHMILRYLKAKFVLSGRHPHQIKF